MNLYITEKPSVARIILVLTLNQLLLTKKQILLFSLILMVIVSPGVLATCFDY